MLHQNTEKEFDEAFMNNGVNGVLDNKYQDPKMLIIKDFITSRLI